MLQNIQKDQSTAALRRMVFAAELSAARNEVQYIDLGDIGSGDTFTLTYEGQTTAPISYNATPATLASNIDTALENLSNIGSTEVLVAHVSAAIYSVTFSGTLAALNFNLITIASPTTFTPGTVTYHIVGGVINAPALGEDFTTSDVTICKNGGTSFSATAGTFTEAGGGAYWYNPTVGEVDTEGPLVLALNKSGLASNLFLYQITPLSSSDGETVIATGTAQTGDVNTIRLASAYDPGP